MPAVEIDDVVQPITAAEFKASLYEGMATVGVSTTTWKPGAVTRTIIAIIAVCLGALSSLIHALAQSAFLGTAAGLWAKLHARYVFNVEPQEATFARGTVLMSNFSATPRSYAPYALEVKASSTGKSYRNVDAVTVAAMTSNVPVTVEAVEVGSASSALVGEVGTIVPAVAGLTCTNPAILAGLDDEADEQVKARCNAKLRPFSPRVTDAYAVAAAGALRANGTRLGINRIAVQDLGHCRVHVYAATASGGVPGTVGDLSTDLGALDEAIQTQAVPQAVTCDVFSATERVVDVSATVYVYNTTGATTARVESAIAGELDTFFASPQTAPIGGNRLSPSDSEGFIYAEDIRAVIMRAKVDGASIRAFRTDLHTPGDVRLVAGEVARLGAVQLKVIRVAPTSGAF